MSGLLNFLLFNLILVVEQSLIITIIEETFFDLKLLLIVFISLFKERQSLNVGIRITFCKFAIVKTNFDLIYSSEVNLRKEHEDWVLGEVYILRA